MMQKAWEFRIRRGQEDGLRAAKSRCQVAIYYLGLAKTKFN
jgi:hypothetical protein